MTTNLYPVFAPDLFRPRVAKVAPAAPVFTDINWKVLFILKTADLATMVDADQLADFLAEIAALPLEAQYRKITAQIALEEAHRLQPTGCDRNCEACPFCYMVKDEESEIPF